MLFKRKEVVKEVAIRIRLTKAEKAEIKALAKAEKLPVSEFFLRTLRKRKGGARSQNADVLLEVRNLGVLLKSLHRLDNQDRDLYRLALIKVADVLSEVPLKLAADS